MFITILEPKERHNLKVIVEMIVLSNLLLVIRRQDFKHSGTMENKLLSFLSNHQYRAA